MNATPSLNHARATGKPEVLLIAADSSIRGHVATSLERDYNVHTADSSHELMSICHHYALDAVFLDMDLPAGETIHALHHLRDWNPHLFIVKFSMESFFEQCLKETMEKMHAANLASLQSLQSVVTHTSETVH